MEVLCTMRGWVTLFSGNVAIENSPALAKYAVRETLVHDLFRPREPKEWFGVSV